MNERSSDLLALIGEARRLVPDDRYIRCAACETFDSHLTQRRGLLLGGACFPAAGDSLAAASQLEEFAIIETGGENHEVQYDRLRFLMRELQHGSSE